MQREKPNGYGPISRFNHWIIALAIIAMLGLGLALEYVEFERSTKGTLMGIHKATGVIILAFVIWRISWRLWQGFPDMVGNMPQWQKIGAKLVHWGLLILMFLMPFSGMMMSLYSGRAINVFGLFSLPAQEKIELISGIAHFIHGYGSKILIALIALHLIAALKHHFLDKDETLLRMLK